MLERDLLASDTRHLGHRGVLRLVALGRTSFLRGNLQNNNNSSTAQQQRRYPGERCCCFKATSRLDNCRTNFLHEFELIGSQDRFGRRLDTEQKQLTALVLRRTEHKWQEQRTEQTIRRGVAWLPLTRIAQQCFACFTHVEHLRLQRRELDFRLALAREGLLQAGGVFGLHLLAQSGHHFAVAILARRMRILHLHHHHA